MELLQTYQQSWKQIIEEHLIQSPEEHRKASGHLTMVLGQWVCRISVRHRNNYRIQKQKCTWCGNSKPLTIFTNALGSGCSQIWPRKQDHDLPVPQRNIETINVLITTILTELNFLSWYFEDNKTLRSDWQDLSQSIKYFLSLVNEDKLLLRWML